MKKFTLICDHEHEFEGWFSSSEAITEQVSQKLLDCPFCGSQHIRKQLSAPNLSSPKTRARMRSEPPASEENSAAHAVATSNAGRQLTAQARTEPNIHQANKPQHFAGPASDMQAHALRMAIKQLHKTIQAEFKNVGEDFAEQARKMHYGEKENENIYGTCSPDETKELIDEGIEIAPIPVLPSEH